MSGTVPTESSAQTFTGGGAAVEFAVSFPIQNTSDLKVWLTLSGATVPTLQVEGIDYDVDDAPSDEPTVTMAIAPPAASMLLIERTVPITQEVNLLTNGPFSPATLTEMLDKRAYVEQQLERRIVDLEGVAGGLVGTLTFGDPVEITNVTASAGSGYLVARANHQHPHGIRGGNNLHAVASPGVPGFMSGQDKGYLDRLTAPRSYVQVDNNVAQSIPHNVATTVKFALKKLDTLNEYDVATGIFTAASAGYYLASAQIRINLTAADAADVILSLLGPSYQVTHNGQAGVRDNMATPRVTGLFLLAAGETIRVQITQTNTPAAARALTSNQTENCFTVARMV